MSPFDLFHSATANGAAMLCMSVLCTFSSNTSTQLRTQQSIGAIRHGNHNKNKNNKNNRRRRFSHAPAWSRRAQHVESLSKFLFSLSFSIPQLPYIVFSHFRNAFPLHSFEPNNGFQQDGCQLQLTRSFHDFLFLL